MHKSWCVSLAYEQELKIFNKNDEKLKTNNLTNEAQCIVRSVSVTLSVP